MTDFMKLLEEARLEDEAEEMEQRDVFLTVIEQKRRNDYQRVKEDPMTMWHTAAKAKQVYKLHDAENPGVILVTKKPKKNPTFGEGFLSGAAFVVMFLIMALLVLWAVFG